jgi:hypothetical protein
LYGQLEPNGYPFYPFAVESYACLGKDGIDLLGRLGKDAEEAGRGVSKSGFLASAIRELSVGLCRGNYYMYRGVVLACTGDRAWVPCRPGSADGHGGLNGAGSCSVSLTCLQASLWFLADLLWPSSCVSVDKHGISDRIYYPLHRRIPCVCRLHNFILRYATTMPKYTLITSATVGSESLECS